MAGEAGPSAVPPPAAGAGESAEPMLSIGQERAGARTRAVLRRARKAMDGAASERVKEAGSEPNSMFDMSNP